MGMSIIKIKNNENRRRDEILAANSRKIFMIASFMCQRQKKKMREKIMIFIEKFLEIYYRYKIIILSCLLMIFLVSAKQGFHSLNGKREDTEEPLIRNILLSLTAVCIGWIFYAAGLMPEITYPYFNGSIFLLLELPVI